MPQASPELSAQWPGGSAEALRFLRGAGYRLRDDWHWEKPSPEHVITEKEGSALDYLCDEWDYGGIVLTNEGNES